MQYESFFELCSFDAKMFRWKMLMKRHFKQLFRMIIMTRHNMKCYGLMRYDKSQMTNGESYTALNICYQYWLRTTFQRRTTTTTTTTTTRTTMTMKTMTTTTYSDFPIMNIRAGSDIKKEKTQISQMRHFWLHRCCTNVASKALLNSIAHCMNETPYRIKQISYEWGCVFLMYCFAAYYCNFFQVSHIRSNPIVNCW